MLDEQYLKGLENWRADTDSNLRRKNDQLALAGLFWLQKGFNTFGSSRDCDIRLPKPAPRIIGAFEFDGSGVTLTLDTGQSIDVNGVRTGTPTVLNGDTLSHSQLCDIPGSAHGGHSAHARRGCAPVGQLPPRT